MRGIAYHTTMETRETFIKARDSFGGKSPIYDLSFSVKERRDAYYVARAAMSHLTCAHNGRQRVSIDSLASKLSRYPSLKRRRISKRRIIDILAGLTVDDLIRVEFCPDRRLKTSPERVWVSYNPDHFEVEAKKYAPLDLIMAV